MCKALILVGGSEAEETAKFTTLFDKFFDCMNISNFTNAKSTESVFKHHTAQPQTFVLWYYYVLDGQHVSLTL